MAEVNWIVHSTGYIKNLCTVRKCSLNCKFCKICENFMQAIVVWGLLLSLPLKLFCKVNFFQCRVVFKNHFKNCLRPNIEGLKCNLNSYRVQIEKCFMNHRNFQSPL